VKLLLLAAGLGSMTAAYERGDLDEAGRQGALAGPVVVERALAAPGRPARLAGIAAAITVEDRAELLPALATVAGTADRRVAIPAARAARTIARELGRHELADDLANDDLATWQRGWQTLAREGDRFVEVRVLALDTAAALAHVRDPNELGFELDVALADRDPAVRVAAIALVPVPTPIALRAALATAVASDAEPAVALAAAQALCADLVTDDPAPVLAALGAKGVERVRALVAAGGASAALRDAARCVTTR
jgi:hypothetical protein